MADETDEQRASRELVHQLELVRSFEFAISKCRENRDYWTRAISTLTEIAEEEKRRLLRLQTSFAHSAMKAAWREDGLTVHPEIENARRMCTVTIPRGMMALLTERQRDNAMNYRGPDSFGPTQEDDDG